MTLRRSVWDNWKAGTKNTKDRQITDVEDNSGRWFIASNTLLSSVDRERFSDTWHAKSPRIYSRSIPRDRRVLSLEAFVAWGGGAERHFLSFSLPPDGCSFPFRPHGFAINGPIRRGCGVCRERVLPLRVRVSRVSYGHASQLSRGLHYWTLRL